MSFTITRTQTFTITHARYVSSKIAADLDLLRAYYGSPSEKYVTIFAEEAALLLAARYLGLVEYGLRVDGLTLIALRYVSRSDGTLSCDDRPGRVPVVADLGDVIFYSFLEYSAVFHRLTQIERERFEATLPIQRTVGHAPSVARNGYWEQTRTYSSNGEGVLRHVFRPR